MNRKHKARRLQDMTNSRGCLFLEFSSFRLMHRHGMLVSLGVYVALDQWFPVLLLVAAVQRRLVQGHESVRVGLTLLTTQCRYLQNMATV